MLRLEVSAMKKDTYLDPVLNLNQRIAVWVKENYTKDIDQITDGIISAASSGNGDRYFLSTAKMIIAKHQKLKNRTGDTK
jgi:hypothetical protein